MKKHFLVALLCLSTLAPFARAEIVDETQTSVDIQIQVLRDRQAGIRQAKAILSNSFNVFETAPDVKLTMPDLPDGLRGSYSFHGRIIRINNRDSVHSYAALITFHEVGHFLDHLVLAPAFVPGAGDTLMASESTAPQMAAYHAAIKNSRTWRGLESLLKSEKTKPGSQREKYLLYVMSPAEMFARSFAQYMAIKSGDAVLQKQMNDFAQSDWPWTGSFYPDDFAPIYKALDELFQSNAWLKTPAAARDTEG